MRFEISWSTEAKHDLRDYAEYLDAAWPARVLERFWQELEMREAVLARQPDMYPLYSGSRMLRICRVDRHTALLYYIEPEDAQVWIQAFHHHARNPNRLQF